MALAEQLIDRPEAVKIETSVVRPRRARGRNTRITYIIVQSVLMAGWCF
jgi:hypothetical protein